MEKPGHAVYSDSKLASVSDPLKQPQIMILPPQTCTVDARHDGFITSSAALLTVMPPSLSSELNLDSSKRNTFLHCPRVQS